MVLKDQVRPAAGLLRFLRHAPQALLVLKGATSCMDRRERSAVPPARRRRAKNPS